ncbi:MULTISPECIES: PIN-like domain-containing protein [unclassified Mesorhizobium]|uniref:PIN-like domain-containing protein n=1 Tax=unclassified Mesorhizobium TaxID=325217 RepID=UPI0003CE21B6|nr:MULTISPECIES: PIN-like domain-containing protein [unclassified Mesorhizobium]ESY24383.1 hypothetical protein X750_11885 [Mesorhizobium sp. LNJC394B00]ESZ77638.1 hypothetical protein X726_08610 [Mesorhizobium sp. L103C105A0]
MRKTFHGFYEPTAAEFEKIWSEGLLVPDTNVLLHLFRFMPKQRAEVLAAFQSFGQRLWLPHQVGQEFQLNWRSADSSNRGEYRKLKDKLATKKGEVESLVSAFSRYDPWPAGSGMKNIGGFFDHLAKEVDDAVGELPDAQGVFAAVTDLFEGKVADQPKDIEGRAKEGTRRAAAEIPPGYMDKRPGDYLIWAEMKQKAKSTNAPILFITDDAKEDWWLIQSGKTVGPRPELRQEFFAETGQLFYSYAPARFLALVADRTKNIVSPETVKEMRRAELDAVASSWAHAANSLKNRSVECTAEPERFIRLLMRYCNFVGMRDSIGNGSDRAEGIRLEMEKLRVELFSLLKAETLEERVGVFNEFVGLGVRALPGRWGHEGDAARSRLQMLYDKAHLSAISDGSPSAWGPGD